MATLLDESALTKELATIPAWIREGAAITRTYTFKQYLEGAAFVQKAAEAAEAMNHHPEVTLLWRKVNVRLSTHSAKGLTTLDFTLARQLDSLL